MTTQGDRVQDRALAEVGGKGLFVKELEVAMQEGRADIAVHSMKDVPSELPPGFCITAVLPRANPHDAFLSLRHQRFADLPQGARVGTSSPRRQAQLQACAAGSQARAAARQRGHAVAPARGGRARRDPARLRGTRAPRPRQPHHAGARPRAVAARGRPGRDRHRVPRGRCSQPCRAGRAASRAVVRATEGRARLRADAGRQLPLADRGARVARRRARSSCTASSVRRTGARSTATWSAAARPTPRLSGGGSRPGCRRPAQGRCSIGCATRPQRHRDARARGAHRRRHAPRAPGGTVRRNAARRRRQCNPAAGDRDRADRTRRGEPGRAWHRTNSTGRSTPAPMRWSGRCSSWRDLPARVSPRLVVRRPVRSTSRASVSMPCHRPRRIPRACSRSRRSPTCAASAS